MAETVRLDLSAAEMLALIRAINTGIHKIAIRLADPAEDPERLTNGLLELVTLADRSAELLALLPKK